MKPLYIGATLKDCGKTSVSLGLMQMLKARGLDPGYCKPVGQHYVRYHEKNIDEKNFATAIHLQRRRLRHHGRCFPMLRPIWT